MAFYVVFFVFILAVLSSFLFVALVPQDQANAWSATPLSGLAQFLAVPPWLAGVLTLFVLAAVLLMLIPAAYAALEDIEQLLRRLSVEGLLPGHVANSANVAAIASVLLTVASGAQVSWLSRAYGISIAVALLLRIGVNARLRKIHHEQHPFRTPVAGVIVVSGVVGLSALAILVSGDVPSIAALDSLRPRLVARGRPTERRRRSSLKTILLSSPPQPKSLSVMWRHARASMITVRHPDSLAHVVAAMKAAGDRDVVAVTVRLLGVDVDEEGGGGTTSTRDERYLFSQVVALTERYARPVRLLIVPAQNVFDGESGGSQASLVGSPCRRVRPSRRRTRRAFSGKPGSAPKDRRSEASPCHSSSQRTGPMHTILALTRLPFLPVISI